jgi:hypothetical protein
MSMPKSPDWSVKHVGDSGSEDLLKEFQFPLNAEEVADATHNDQAVDRQDLDGRHRRNSGGGEYGWVEIQTSSAPFEGVGELRQPRSVTHYLDRVGSDVSPEPRRSRLHVSTGHALRTRVCIAFLVSTEMLACCCWRHAADAPTAVYQMGRTVFAFGR